MQYCTKFAASFAATFAVFAIICVSAALNFRFGLSLGRSNIEGFLYGIVSVAADILKAFLPVLIFAAWQAKHYLKSIIITSLFAIFFLYSLTSSLGFTAENRAEKTGSIQAKNNKYADMKIEIKKLEKQKNNLPSHRPYEAVTSLIKGIKNNKRWDSSKNCTNATIKASRQLCTKYHNLVAEQAIAKLANDLETKIAKVRAKLDKSAKPKIVDAQAGLISKLTGLSLISSQSALSVLLSMLIEFGSSFGLFAITGLGKPAAKPSKTVFKTSTAAKTDYSAYLHQRIEKQASQALKTLVIYKDFLLWCKKSGQPDLTLSEFEKFMQVEGYQSYRKDGTKYYRDIILKTLH